MGLSNHLIGILNFVTALLSIPVLGAGLWLMLKVHATDCMRFLQWPLIILGLFLLIISLAGLFGSYCRISFLMWIYAACMLLLIVLLFCFTVFAFVVTNKGAGDVVSGKGFKEFHLGNYSSWLQRQVEKDSVWHKIKSCIQDSRTCDSLAEKYTTLSAFNNADDITPIQSGCCKPPVACGFVFGANATTWTKIAATKREEESEFCRVWNNDQTLLCYDCGSCKAGVLQTVKKDWRRVAVLNAIALGFLVFVYSVSCCALRNSRAHDPARKGYVRYAYV